MAQQRDPLLHDVEFPLHGVYYPFGFRVNIATNSRQVLDAARESWGDCRPEFDRPPVEVRCIVLPQGAVVDDFPQFRSQGDLFSTIFDRDNFSVYDRRTMSGHCFVSERTAAAHVRLRVHFLESMVYMLLAQRYGVPVHAASVERGGAGVLICGVSGSGKSTLAFACGRAGWTYVSDDATWLIPDAGPRIATGKPSQARFRENAPLLFPEIAGYPVFARPNGRLAIEVPLSDFPGIRTASRCTLECVVTLDRRAGAAPRAVPVSTAGTLDALLLDIPSYGEEVNAWYERTVKQLSDVPSYRLEYERLDDAVKVLGEIL